MKRSIGVATVLVLILLAGTVGTSAFGESAGLEGFYNDPDSQWGFQSSIELGFFGLFAHQIQFDRDGTYFNYVKDGGQDIWFPFQRISADIFIGPRHRLVLLYQPIDLRTEVQLDRKIVVNDVTFRKNTPMELRYGFDFYRLSYLYDFFDDSSNELAIGASLQIRDAVITFADKAGEQLQDNGDVGPVPALKFRVKYYIRPRLWLGTEIDGIYASGRGFVGSTEVESGFVGAILDASLRAGFTPREYLDAFLNLRYIGGGAEGAETDDPDPDDDFVKNWIHSFSVSLGVTLR